MADFQTSRLLALSMGVVFSTAALAQNDAVSVFPSAAARSVATIDFSDARPHRNTGSVPSTAASAVALRADQAKRGLSAPRAFGTFGIPYTTTRVQIGAGMTTPGATSANLLSVTYPYRAIGKLFFVAGGFNSFCSATVIRRGLIVTAAHCTQDFGAGTSLFSAFSFVPGHYGPVGATTAQREPYGKWSATGVSRPFGWANGTDPGCGAARRNDIAVFALAPKNGRFVGDVVGRIPYGVNYYGFTSSAKTANLMTGAVSTLGYPGLMDDGSIMQRSDGPTYPTQPCGNATALNLWQGSNFTGGSSGGPWIVNFSSAAAKLTGGAVIGSQSAISIIGVTSWGSNDPNVPKDNYSSVFGQNASYPGSAYGSYGAGNIGSLVNSLCARKPAGSTSTFAALGYCS
jgi:hypothetical protein